MTPEALPAGFPLEEAKDWIGKWKRAGGGFFCHPNAETGEVMVQLASQGDLLHTPEEAEKRNANILDLQNELLANPTLKSAITTLVADAWTRASFGSEVGGHG